MQGFVSISKINPAIINNPFSYKNYKNRDNSDPSNQNSFNKDLKLEEDIKKRMIIQKLRMIERKVINHEMAHKMVGGKYTGTPRYTYTKGPDGKYYITGGEVPIDTSEERTPEETIKKMQIVRAAALAPADPSPQDIRVAQIASMKEMKARLELMRKKYQKEKEVYTNQNFHNFEKIA